jgi:hypothetical protein
MESNTKKLNLEMIGQKMADFFSGSVETVALQTKFVQRQSPLSGEKFLKTGVFGFLENPKASLTDLAQVCLELGVKVTPQGLDERINTFSVAFLHEMFNRAMEKFRSEIALPLSILQQFTAINLLDSTQLVLPDNMKEEYPGCGGNGTQASLKIQLVFDFLRGNMQQVVLQAGRQADQAYRDYLTMVEVGSLTIMDLGYFCLDAFQAIKDKGAYFISRYLYPTALSTSDGQRIDLLCLLRKQTDAIIEIPVLLGARHQIACRLILLRLPKQVAQERRRKAKAKAVKRGKPLSKDYLSLLDWTILLTNVPVSMLSIEQVACLYRVRWQIELVFKLWKSYCGLERVALWRKERVLTELYAKMIGIVLMHFLIAPLRIPDLQWSNREISNIQVRKSLARFATRLLVALPHLPSLTLVLHSLLVHIEHFGFKQKRRKKPNVCALLASDLPLPYSRGSLA